jgi:cytochrome P450
MWQVSAIPTSIWLIARLARLSIPAQILESIGDCVKTERTGHEATTLDEKKVVKTSIMKAAFSEMLRLHDAGGCARAVEHDTILTVNQKQYLLEKGSFVTWPLDCVHKDPEIHRNPDEFQVDRFLHLYSDCTLTKR